VQRQQREYRGAGARQSWLSNLPADTDLSKLVRLGKMRWQIEHDYSELKDALDLQHCEGTYRGWNQHVTSSR